MKDCNKKHCILSVVAVFIFVMVYDMLVHGQLLKGMYEATASLWRPEAEMQTMYVWCFLYHFLLAATATCLYGLIAKNSAACDPAAPASCPRKTGLCFGIKLGVIMGLVHSSFYIWMPIPGALAAAWFVSSLGQGIGIGLILSCLCKKKGNAAA